MTIRRVALIFDHRARPETTGVYCRRAMGRLVADVEHLLPDDLGRVAPGDFDLFLAVDDGLDYEIPDRLRPLAAWAIDTHLDFDRCAARLRHADLAFAAQRDGAGQLARAGIPAEWLPLACDPEIHRRHDVPLEHDVAFVGNVFPGPRQDLLRALSARFRRCFVGRCYFDEMAAVYSAARVAFNRSLRGDVNMRVFEAAACGPLVLTDDLAGNGLAELFRPGAQLETYRGEEDLLEKAAYYLARPESAARIGAAGMAEAHARHTYRHRMERILAAAEAGRVVAANVPLGPAADPDRVTPSPAPAAGEIQDGPAKADPGYFGHARPEILALIPPTARRVLDVGCGAGRLGEALKARKPAEVVGIERDPEAARLAAGRLDRVLVGDVERIAPDFEPGSFDTAICGDILEHLRAPERLLARLRDWLMPGGLVVASIPNARHHSVVAGLIEGNWTYEPAGLLDRDHVRFFTRREIEKLFERAGFRVDRMEIVPGPGHAEWVDLGRPPEVRVGRLRVGGLDPAHAEEFYAYQYLVVASREPDVRRDTTSIVILTHNQLDLTRACLDSIRDRTDEPVEVIVVDNASTDGTVEYLRARPDVRLIENDENRGFPAGCNQGIAAATGRHVLLLNNDTVVTAGWLRRLLDHLDRDPGLGLVGPCTNCAGSEQQIDVDYDDLSGLDGFAWDRGKALRGRAAPTDRLIGFCLLIRREALDQIGGLDERFGIGCYEDDDYCRRAAAAGWRRAIALDAFVHHHGGATFRGGGFDHAAAMRENAVKFREKWGEPGGGDAAGPGPDPWADAADGEDLEPATPYIPDYGLVLRPSGGLLIVRKDVHLSLCMIVRDNARTLGPCLASIRPYVDEMVVVDTGSVDDTPRIALDHGARLFEFPWCDDFAAARNESLRHARGRWLFWMDSDDTIPEECGLRLRRLAYGPHARSVLGYVAQVHCPGPGDQGAFDVTAVDHVKLIRNRPDLRFEGRIHEQLLPAIRRAGGDVAWTDIHVVHSGSDHTPEGRARKVERDLRLLALEDAERPDHPFTLFNLGMTYADCGRFEEACESLTRSIGVAGPGESHLRKAYALLVHAQMQLGRREEARSTLAAGRAFFPEDPELRFRQGVLLHEMGFPAEAARAYADLLGHAGGRHFSSVDLGIVGFKARQNLALVLADLGRHDEEEQAWRGVVAEVPRYAQGWRGLGDCLLRRGRVREALALLGPMRAQPGLEAEALLLSARAAEAAGDRDAARRDFAAAADAAPGDAEVLHALCRYLFESGDDPAAEGALLRLLAAHPEDPAALHNLGGLRLRLGRAAEAVEALAASIRARPGGAATRVLMGRALRAAGRGREARAQFEEALRIDPGDPAAREELAREGKAGPSRGRRDPAGARE